MTIDSTGERANETGWTKDALKAEKRAKAKAFWAGVRSRIAIGWDFLLRNMLLWVSLAGLIAISAWEWWNTSRGWQNLYPAVGVFAFIGAAGAIVLYFQGFRRWREEGRAGNGKDSFIWLSVTVAAYFVCVTGVFIATATAAEKAQRLAKESRIEYAKMVIARDDLKAKVELNDPELLQLGVDADKRALKALVDTAVGTYQMPDLDGGSGCPAPPKSFTKERLCAQANGGIDPFNGEVLQGIRTEIQRGEKRVKDAKAQADELEKLNDQIKNFRVREGDETADALGEMLSMNGGSALGWLLLLLSSCFLYGGGWLGDWVFERIEQMRVNARQAKATGP
jgi:hypothetical protein